MQPANITMHKHCLSHVPFVASCSFGIQLKYGFWCLKLRQRNEGKNLPTPKPLIKGFKINYKSFQF